MTPHRKEPDQISAGDSVSWNKAFPGLDVAGLSLSYSIVSRVARYEVDATAGDSDCYSVSIAGATTAGWAPGRYRWVAYLKDGDGNRITASSGEMVVLPNLEAATGGLDDRDSDQKILDAIVALLEGKVLAGDAQHYRIGERELTRYSFSELEALRSKYALRVRNRKIARGERVPSRTRRTSFCG